MNALLFNVFLVPKEKHVPAMTLSKQVLVPYKWIIQEHAEVHVCTRTHTSPHTCRHQFPGLLEEDYSRLLTQLQNPRVSHMNSLNLNVVCSLLGYELCQYHPDETGINSFAWTNDTYGIFCQHSLLAWRQTAACKVAQKCNVSLQTHFLHQN